MPAPLPSIFPLPTTCGLIVVSPQGWLLGHVTSLEHWDLPKGKKEHGETPQQAAIRECLEETGLDFSAHLANLEDLGALTYNAKRGKTLHLFRLKLDNALDLSSCVCHTVVHTRGAPMLDMDQWEWVSEHDVVARLNRRMGKHLRKRKLVSGEPRPKPLKMG